MKRISETKSKISGWIFNWRKRDWLVNYLWLAVIEGFLLSIFILSLSSDPENRIFLNLTRFRLLILLILLLPTLLLLYLAIKAQNDQSWSHKWANIIINNRNFVPYLSVFLLTLILLGGCLVIMYRTSDFSRLNPAYLIRMAPPFIWLGLLLSQLWLIWLWTWKRHAIRIPSSIWDIFAALLLFLISILPRIEMTAYGLPYQSVWDEVVTYTPALNMLTTPGMKPYATVPGYGHSAYGDLVTYIAAGGELLGLFDGLRSGLISSVQEYVAPPQGVNSTFSAVNGSGLPLQAPRILFAILNSLAPVGIYFLLRKQIHTDHWSAFGAGFIYAILSRDVLYYSSYILPDALTATLFIFLIITVWKSIDNINNRLWIFLLSGILAGMMVSLNIRVVLMILVPILAVLLSRNKQHFFAKLLVGITGITVGFLLFSPYAILDLPSYLAKVTGLTWPHDMSLANKLAGLAYYVKGAFMPGFNSLYVDSSEGSVGLGLIAGFLAVLGLGKLLLRYTRQALLLIIIIILHLYLISPITQRYTRHALVLYPVICIFAGTGLSWIAEGAQSIFPRLLPQTNRKISPQMVKAGTPAIILIVFLLISTRQLNLTLRYVSRTHKYEVPQVQAAKFLSNYMIPTDTVGILDVIPWVENDLQARGISFERIPASDTVEDLKAKHITLVAGTDRFEGDYAFLANTIWQTSFKDPGVKLAEFGVGALQYDGYPAGQLYIFIARLP